jgi:hypothetical protein
MLTLRVSLFTVCMTIGLSLSAQMASSNDNDDLFRWKGKKTIPRYGYVILKSGTKLEGTIQLKGSSSNVEEIILEYGGDERKLPPAAVKRYGLIIIEPDNESEEDLYEWRAPMSSSGANGTTVVRRTKPMSGYVVTREGRRVEGELQLKEVNDFVEEYEIKNADGKQTFEYSDLKKFGLTLTIADITKGGSKLNKEEARNFHPTTVIRSDGTQLNGFAAFRHKTSIDPYKPDLGDLFTLLMFTENESQPVTAIDESKIEELIRTENGVQVDYVSFDDGYIVKGQLAAAEYNDPTREFQRGSITLYGGETREGKIAQVKQAMSFKATSIRFEAPDGSLTEYTPKDVKLFQQEIEGEMKQFLGEQGAFVPELFRGKLFVLVRNPYSTTSSALGNFVASTAMSVATSEASSYTAEKTLEKKGYNVTGDADFSKMSNEELQAIIDAPYVGSEIGADVATAAKNGAMMELAGRQAASSFDIKKKEWIIINLKTQQRALFTRDNYKDEIQSFLYGCEDYILLSKQEKRKFNAFDEIVSTLAFVDDCFHRSGQQE